MLFCFLICKSRVDDYVGQFVQRLLLRNIPFTAWVIIKEL